MVVRKGGLEPPCLSAPPPQDGVSANSTTSAQTRKISWRGITIIAKQQVGKELLDGSLESRVRTRVSSKWATGPGISRLQRRIWDRGWRRPPGHHQFRSRS